ncbi:MAG: GNAT family N-acetyltransferase, partial [Chlamydiales bacterium]|nr:GNAT family N-acetyltransferase [Chlamydiales bacterium]
GIIDIAIAVKKEDMEEVCKKLQELGYEFRPSFSTVERFYLVIDLPDVIDGKRRYHIHLTHLKSEDWTGLISFRDYLRTHKAAAQEYAELKKKAALEANGEGSFYRKQKEPFFQKIADLNKISIVQLDRSSLDEAMCFLRKHEDYSLFLLSNLTSYGYRLTGAIHSGNFKLAYLEGRVIAVFCLTKRGSLIIQSEISEDSFFEKIGASCKEEPQPISGLIGEWSFCERLWDFFKKEGVICKQSFASQETLYAIDPSTFAFSSHDNNTRCLVADDYTQWRLLRLAYLKEQQIPGDFSETELQALFLEKVKARIVWGYFLDEQLVSIADLNAKALDLGQVGGVYTMQDLRNQGFAKSVMCQLIKDAQAVHHIRKLIIFTGKMNHPAQKLYESLGVHPIGHYALFFGK